LFKKIHSYYDKFTNIGIEHVATEFDKRVIRLLNLVCILGITIIIPLIAFKQILEADYLSLILLFTGFLVEFIVVYLNYIGKSQLACLLLIFSLTTLGYPAAFILKNEIDVPFVILSFGFFSIFLVKNKVWKLLSFSYTFISFAILFYILFSIEQYSIISYIIVLLVLMVFSLGLYFINTMRNRNETIILNQNEQLKEQNDLIKQKSEQLLQLEKEKYQQELLLKQKDMEMILANNQVQTQLNGNIIDKLKGALKKGELEKNINLVILELYHQNEINTKMKLIEQNLDMVNTSFFENLTNAHPNMTRVDKEFCSYIKIGLSTKEIAIIRNTTSNSIHVAKSRLRKKLQLESNTDIASYLNAF